jgi:hypothetical protein
MAAIEITMQGFDGERVAGGVSKGVRRKGGTANAGDRSGA